MSNRKLRVTMCRIAQGAMLSVFLGSMGCADGEIMTNLEFVSEGMETREVMQSPLTEANGALGTSCASGCVWSSLAVNLGAQTATHACAGAACACVVDGDVRASCNVVNSESPSDSSATATAGLPCANGCIWSAQAVSLGVQLSLIHI